MKYDKKLNPWLKKDFGVAVSRLVSEEDVLLALEKKISDLINHSPESFFQLMYKLDIPENRLSDMLCFANISAADIAREVYDRQLKKIETRRQFSSPAKEDIDDELKW